MIRQSLLLASTGLGRLTRFTLTAARSPYRRPLTTLLPYRTPAGAVLLSAVFRARARNFDSVLERNMFDDALPEEIYTQLVRQVNDALPVFHRYLKLRGEMLGVDEMRYYDIYPPLLQADTGTFGLTRSEEITFAALEPFGEALEEKLDPAQLMRVHRSAFARPANVVEVQRLGRTISAVVLRDGAIVQVGPNYSKAVAERVKLAD